METISQKLDSLDRATIKNFEGTKGLFTSQLIPTIKDNQAKIHDDLLASRKTNDQALKRLSEENQKLSKELISILGENLIQGVDTKNQVESIDKNVAAASQNIAVNNKNLMLADEKINILLSGFFSRGISTSDLISTFSETGLREINSENFPKKISAIFFAVMSIKRDPT